MNMKQHATRRRILSILLSAMMLLSMIPAAVFQSSAAANAWDDYTNEAEGGWHFFVDEIGETTFTWTDSPYLSALLNGPGNWVNNSDWFCDWLSRDEYPGDVFYAVLGKNAMATANTWMDGSMNDGSEGNIANGNYTGLNKKLYAQFGGFMWTVTNGYLVTLNADDFDLTFQGPGTAMGNKDDAAVVINKGHMSFTDGIVVTNTGNVAVDVKSAGVIDLISDATIGAEGSKIGLRNEGTITSITGGTFYNFDNKGTVGSITGGTFDYSQAPEGVSFESIRSAVAENAEIEEIDTGVFQVTSTEEPEPDPEDPNWDYVDAGRGDGSIEITNYKGGVGAVTVPAEINGHKVVGLGNGALYQKGITSLVISEGIEYLGDDAVMFNNEMTSMTLPSTLNTVGDNCFALAYALTNVDLPEACINFVDDPDYDCALGADKNGLGIFYGLGDNGNNVTEPGTATVTCYTEEAKAVLEAGNAKNAELNMDTYTINYVQQGVEDPTWEYADSGRGDGTIEITGYKGAYGTPVVVPATINDQKVVGVADKVAIDCGAPSVTVSEGIEYIGAYAFSYMVQEGQGTSIALPSTLTSLGQGAFGYLFYLSNVTVPVGCVNFPDAPDGVTGNKDDEYAGPFYGSGFSVGGCTVTVYTQEAQEYFQTVAEQQAVAGLPPMNVVYEAPAAPVTVTFDANGGENAPAAVEVNANEAYTLPGAGEMTRENYIFAGWALSADATAEDVVTEITPTQATTVYAVWTKAPKDGGANVGTVAPGAPVVLNGSQFKTIGKANLGEEDTSNLMTRDVTFEMVDGKLQVVAVVYDEDLVTVNRPDWAEWETECFELMIDPYNTYTPADYAAAYRDNLIQLRINTAGRLSGRWMAETIGGVADDQLPTESAFDGKFQGTVAIDGAWLTYTFVVDLSEFGIEEGNAIGFDAHAVSCPDTEQSGWQYISYYIKADGTCSGDDGQNVWEANKWDYLTLSYVEAPATVTVTFDANGGENAPAAVEVNANEVYTLPGAGEMTRENYTFAGWALSADATAEDVVTEITPTESMTVYAVWTEVTAPCEHPEDQQRLVVDTEPGYYFHGVGHIVCDECGATIEEDVDIEPLPLTDAYNDVNPDGWYVPGVAMMTDLGIMSGKGDGIFDPDGTMLRSEMAMTMYQMLADPEEDLSDVELPFTDVSEDHWAINAIKWCYKHGIVSGATPTTFEPDSQILREQFVSMFYRYMVSEMTEEEYQEMVAGIDQTILDQFPDGAAIDDYAVEAMQVFVQAGVITGSDGMLAARGACSRGQVAQILRTILELGMGMV